MAMQMNIQNNAWSEPYAPLPSAPANFSLDDALRSTVNAQGQHTVGHLIFPDTQQLEQYKVAQRAIGGTPEQLSVLYLLTQEGPNSPRGAQVLAARPSPAPPGTTVDQLLTVQRTNGQGYHELGTLRVHATEYAQFSQLQRTLCGRNPEALALLYHMEHARGTPLTFRVTADDDRQTRYEPGRNTIYWNPNSAVRDALSPARVSPDTAALHEESHWAGRRFNAALFGVPAGPFTNFEELRVLRGTERDDMEILNRTQRQSKFGTLFPVDGINSISPALTVQQGLYQSTKRAPWEQTGRIYGEVGDTTTLVTRGDGRDPRFRITFKTEQLSWALRGGNRANLPAAVDTLQDAQRNNDAITIKITHDRLIYSNPAQERRLQARSAGQASHSYTR